MKNRLTDLVLSFSIVFFISTLLVTILIGLNWLLRLPSIALIIVWSAASILLFYSLIVNPTKLLLSGLLRVRPPQEFVEYFMKFYRKYEGDTRHMNIVLQVIEDEGYCAMFVQDLWNTHYIFSSKLVNDWNEIDIESSVLYLLELHKHTYPLRDSGILVLASIAERIIITSFVGAALIHLVRSHHHDAWYDSEAVKKMQFVQGYQNMLTKYGSGSGFASRLPASFGMNGVGDITRRGVNQALFAVHETIESRIEALDKDPLASHGST